MAPSTSTIGYGILSSPAITPSVGIATHRPRISSSVSFMPASRNCMHADPRRRRQVDDDTADPDVAAVVRRLVADERAFQNELCWTLGIERERAVTLGRLLFALDWLSLALCSGWATGELPAVAGTAIRYEPQDARNT